MRRTLASSTARAAASSVAAHSLVEPGSKVPDHIAPLKADQRGSGDSLWDST